MPYPDQMRPKTAGLSRMGQAAMASPAAQGMPVQGLLQNPGINHAPAGGESVAQLLGVQAPAQPSQMQAPGQMPTMGAPTGQMPPMGQMNPQAGAQRQALMQAMMQRGGGRMPMQPMAQPRVAMPMMQPGLIPQG